MLGFATLSKYKLQAFESSKFESFKRGGIYHIFQTLINFQTSRFWKFEVWKFEMQELISKRGNIIGNSGRGARIFIQISGAP